MGEPALASDRMIQLLHPEPVEVEGLRRWLGLTQVEFGGAVGRSRRTVARWSASPRPVAEFPSAVAARLRKLARLRFLLETLLEPGTAPEWLRSANAAFEGEAPLDLLVSGRADELVAALEVLADGGAY